MLQASVFHRKVTLRAGSFLCEGFSDGCYPPRLPWFRFYSKALLTKDPLARHVYVKAALGAIHETLCQPMIEQAEREAISAAIRDLNLLECDTPSAKAS
jgi:hypothetical protein